MSFTSDPAMIFFCVTQVGNVSAYLIYVRLIIFRKYLGNWEHWLSAPNAVEGLMEFEKEK